MTTMRVAAASFNNNTNASGGGGGGGGVVPGAADRVSSRTNSGNRPAARPRQHHPHYEPFTREVLPWPVIEIPQFCREQGSFEQPEDCFILVELSDSKRTLYIQASPQWTSMQLLQHMRELLVVSARQPQDTILPYTGYLVSKSDNNARIKLDFSLSEQNIQPSNATKRNPARLLFVTPTQQQLQQEAAAATAAAAAAAAASLNTTTASNTTAAAVPTATTTTSAAASQQLMHQYPSSMIGGGGGGGGISANAISFSHHGISTAADAVASALLPGGGGGPEAQQADDGSGHYYNVDDVDPFLKELEQKYAIPSSSLFSSSVPTTEATAISSAAAAVVVDLDKCIKDYIEKYQECLTDEEEEEEEEEEEKSGDATATGTDANEERKKNGKKIIKTDELNTDDGGEEADDEAMPSPLDDIGASEMMPAELAAGVRTVVAAQSEKPNVNSTSTEGQNVILVTRPPGGGGGKSDVSLVGNTLTLVSSSKSPAQSATPGTGTVRNSNGRASDAAFVAGASRGGSALVKAGSARRPSAKQQ